MKVGRIEYSPDYKSERQSPALLRALQDVAAGRVTPLEQVREKLRLEEIAHEPPCPKCHQVNVGQTGEYPCELCGLPRTWDTERPQ